MLYLAPPLSNLCSFIKPFKDGQIMSLAKAFMAFDMSLSQGEWQGCGGSRGEEGCENIYGWWAGAVLLGKALILSVTGAGVREPHCSSPAATMLEDHRCEGCSTSESAWGSLHSVCVCVKQAQHVDSECLLSGFWPAVGWGFLWSFNSEVAILVPISGSATDCLTGTSLNEPQLLLLSLWEVRRTVREWLWRQWQPLNKDVKC